MLKPYTINKTALKRSCNPHSNLLALDSIKEQKSIKSRKVNENSPKMTKKSFSTFQSRNKKFFHEPKQKEKHFKKIKKSNYIEMHLHDYLVRYTINIHKCVQWQCMKTAEIMTKNKKKIEIAIWE